MWTPHVEPAFAWGEGEAVVVYGRGHLHMRRHKGGSDPLDGPQKATKITAHPVTGPVTSAR
jgi:hypothetical protein